ncbi:MAG: thioredoxin domain-containing protein, partial [Acidobacteria bacterium]|nr:thioredoxin domain-containing protein [Acidobacteriota bacterium]
LLSIGYSACHWCHVMEHESFEDESTARIMNQNFINIKVDREERPDLDAIYMQAVQMLTGHGGWPMTVFLTPAKVPFYGGTYFPPEDRHGLPGFPRVLTGIANVYREKREQVETSSAEILANLGRMASFEPAGGELSFELLEGAFQALKRAYDPTNGGFGTAPKFPGSMSLTFLLWRFARTGDAQALEMAESSMKKMARGGIYDHVGGGFHRYSVDEKWLIPHFEKMLYDNALLARLYLDGFRVTGQAFYRRIAEETLEYVMREMTHASGGFTSTQDADSEGHEGKFFVWTPDEIEQVLGRPDAEFFCQAYDVTALGNFEGKTVLNIPRDPEITAKLAGITPDELESRLAAMRSRLREVRERRVKPGLDDKILTSWNGLMIRSFAEAGAVLARADFLNAARRSADFLWSSLRQGDQLLRTYRNGSSKLDGYLEDYAHFADGLLALYFATFEVDWFARAHRLIEAMLDRFWDHEGGGFYFTARTHEPLITRTKDFYDNATPSGNSVAVHVLLQMHALTGEFRYLSAAETVLKLISDAAFKYPSGFGHMLCAVEAFLSRVKEIAIIGHPEDPGTRSLLDVVRQGYLPNAVVAVGLPGNGAVEVPLLRERGQVDGRPTAYVCEHFSCREPVTSPEALRELLQERTA